MPDELYTVVEQRDEGGQREESDFLLTVTAGPGKGRSFRIGVTQASRVLLGQRPGCEVRLTDRSVSRRHAALERVGLDLRLTDMGSTNGTFVDRVRVVEAILSGGEFVRVGQTMFRVEREAAQERALPEAIAYGRVVG